jgi:hypothetical protein
MKKDTIENLFDRLQGEFDVFETPNGHQKRFMDRLQKQEQRTTSVVTWKKVISIAAVFAVIVTLGSFFFNSDVKAANLASVSPEMEQTQSFFTTAINNEIQTLKSFDSPETEALINDALKQIDILESKYQILMVDLVDSGYDQRVIYAMINNFQKRIDLLENVINTVKEIKNLNNQNNENTI